MKGNRLKNNGETLPVIEIERIGKYQFQIRYAFEEVPAHDDMPASFDYEYINVSELTTKTIKKAIIKTKYDYDDEIAVINEKDNAPQKYAEYQTLRNTADWVIEKLVEEKYIN